MKRGELVLLVDDDPAVLRGVGGLLRDEGYRTEALTSAGAAFERLSGSPEGSGSSSAAAELPAAVLLDLRMPHETGLELLARLPKPLAVPVVVLSGEASAREAAEAIRLGATDFVEKPPSAERLLTALRNAVALSSLSEERERLKEALAQPGNLVGESLAMRQLRETLAQVGPSDALVLITGETGTGKERVARALHLASGRAGRFVAVNCAAIPHALLESELFGYERGAFTGAAARRLGRFEQAQGGTLLLDEIGDMPFELQSKLLRVLEERAVERLGGQGPIPVNVRVLAATHQDLAARVKEGRFRQDLFYRLGVFPVRLPPLRDRPEDILPLAHAFAAELLGAKIPVEVPPEAERALRAYPWPGNVRELRNHVERLALLRRGGPLVLDARGLVAEAPPHSGVGPAAGPSPAIDGLGEKAYRELVEDFERALIRRALEDCGGNLAGAARLLRVDRGNLHRRAKVLGISVGER